jgi:hypothetical protein
VWWISTEQGGGGTEWKNREGRRGKDGGREGERERVIMRLFLPFRHVQRL